MRFNDFDPNFSIVKLGDGQPIKVAAADASRLPDGTFEFNQTLFDLLRIAFENEDRKELNQLWLAAHRYARPAAAQKVPIALLP